MPIYVEAQILSSVGKSAEVAAPIIAGVKIKDLIHDARQEATTLIADGRNSGDVLMTRAGDELNMMADNVLRLASSEMDSTIEDVDKLTSKVLVSLYNATLSAKSFGTKIYDIRDTTSLDIRSILGEIPLVNEKLLVQRIQGLTQLINKTDYQMEILASYVGTPSEEHSTDIEIILNDKKLEGVKVNPAGLHHAILRIPNASLESYFLKEEIAFVDAKVFIKQKFKKGWWVFKSWDEKSYTVPLNLTLYPSYAGTLQVTAREKVYGWKSIGSKSNSATGGNNHCSRSCGGHRGNPYEVSVTVSGGIRTPQIPGDQKITNISSCHCISGTCGYDEHNHSVIDLDNTRARCGWQGRSHPSTWRITAEIMQWLVVDEIEKVTDVKVYWDNNFEVRIPNTSSMVKIRGLLLSGRKIDLVDGQPEPKNSITRVALVENHTDKSLIYRVNRPEGM